MREETDLDLWYEDYSNFVDGELATMEVSLRFGRVEPLELESWFRYTIQMQLGISNR